MGIKGCLIRILLIDEEAPGISYRAMNLVEQITRFSSRLLGHFTKKFNRFCLAPWLDYISYGKTNQLGIPF